jgi:MFS family permease
VGRIPLGALGERNFRLLFTSATVSALGDGVAMVALVFAVLQVSDSAIVLGGVLAARQVTNAAVVLAAGVWADRLPRHVVLVVVAGVQGIAQAATGILVLGGNATVWSLIALQALYGLAEGFVHPAETGLTPATVSPARLQDANALLGLSRNTTRIIGPALGGALAALGSPGAALLVDAASFGIAAIVLLPLRLPAQVRRAQSKPFFAELREGWGEFRRQTWLWTTIVFFGIGNCVSTSVLVLGPIVAKRHYSGASTWGLLISSFGVGTIIGGLVALRIRPQRPLLASCVAAVPLVLQPLGIGLKLPVTALVTIYVVSGIGLAIHLALWFTVFQRHVPEDSRSRVSSYDALGSFVLMPLGSAVAGPVASLIGITPTLFATAAIEIVCFAIIIAQPSVWAIGAEPAASPALA